MNGNVFKARVYMNGRKFVASHFIDIEDEATGRVKIHFRRLIHNLPDEAGEFPIPRMKAASFKEQLRSMNRAYAVTSLSEGEERDFVTIMMKEAYGDDIEIVFEDLT